MNRSSPNRSHRLHGLETRLDRWHRRARAIPALYRLAIISRIALAVAFIPTGMVKVLGRRFTRMSPETPIGYFFEALYQSGPYWEFIGWGQVVAGVLLLIPPATTLGAVLAFPIVLSVFVITVSLQFRGTPIVTGGMLLASTFLLCWDYHRLKAIVFSSAAPSVLPEPGEISRIPRLEKVGYGLGLACGLGVFLSTRNILVPSAAIPTLLVLSLVAGVVVVVAWVRSIL